MSRYVRNRIFSALAVVGLSLQSGSQALADALYSVTDLGNGGWSLLNNNGQVAGDGYTTPHTVGTYTEVYNGNSGGQVSVIGVTPPSATSPGSYNYWSQPVAMNDSGQLIVERFDSNPGWYLYSGGQLSAVPGIPSAINDAGAVAGIDGGPNQVYVKIGGVETLFNGLPGGQISSVVAINNSGQFIGNSSYSYVPTDNQGYDYSKATGWTHAFLYNGNSVVDLGTLGGNVTFAQAMNAHGDVVGYSGTQSLSNPSDPNQVNHAFLVPFGGKMIDLGVLPGTTQSAALGINDQGQVVGISGTGYLPLGVATNLTSSHAFLYQNGVMTDLNTLVPISGITLTAALAINNQGQILADGVDSKGDLEQFLLTPAGESVPPPPVYPEAPVPEPSALAVLGSAVVVFAIKRLRKRD
jgi:probable HAF family extracellular repeat protein